MFVWSPDVFLLNRWSTGDKKFSPTVDGGGLLKLSNGYVYVQLLHHFDL